MKKKPNILRASLNATINDNLHRYLEKTYTNDEDRRYALVDYLIAHVTVQTFPMPSDGLVRIGRWTYPVECFELALTNSDAEVAR
jgi:hypothetical protein